MRFNNINTIIITLIIITFAILGNTTVVKAQQLEEDGLAMIHHNMNDGHAHSHEANTNPTTNNALVLETVLQCPHCGHKSHEAMPTNSCKFFHKCGNCSELVKPKEGECCVFCSYGESICPPAQEHEQKINR